MPLSGHGHINSAMAELKNLNTIYDTLTEQKDSYKASQVQIQIKTSEAWILFQEGKNIEALKLINLAADMEDKPEKPCYSRRINTGNGIIGRYVTQNEQIR